MRWFRDYLVIFLSLALFSAGCGGCTRSEPHTEERKDSNEDPSPLSPEEVALLRSRMQDGVTTRINADSGFFHREIALGTDVVALHRKHRIATIKLLLGIVKRGSPKEARHAAATAIALEEGPRSAVTLADWNVDTLDEEQRDGLPTQRQMLIESVEKALANAEKELQVTGKK